MLYDTVPFGFQLVNTGDSRGTVTWPRAESWLREERGMEGELPPPWFTITFGDHRMDRGEEGDQSCHWDAMFSAT